MLSSRVATGLLERREESRRRRLTASGRTENTAGAGQGREGRGGVGGGAVAAAPHPSSPKLQAGLGVPDASLAWVLQPGDPVC